MYEIDIIILVVLLLLSAFFSGMEIALVSVSELKVRTLRELKKKGSKTLEKIKSNPKKMIITVLIGNNIVNVGASAYSGWILTGIFGSAGVGIATAVMTLLILTFGEILPKTYFAKHSERISLRFAKLIYTMQIALFPIIIIFEWLAKAVAPDSEHTVSENEIKTLIEMGAEGDVLHSKQEEVMKSAFRFDDIPVKEIMTPRVDIFALPEKVKVKSVIKKIKFAGFSRIPIYKEGLDEITGYVHIRDLLHVKLNAEMKTLSSKVIIVSSEKIIQDLLIEMQKEGYHMAVVVDEFGGTAGIVTMEDILEELVGEIRDETDDDEWYIKRMNKSTYFVSGDANIEDVNDELGTKISTNKGYSTISGYLQTKFKDLPKEGDSTSTPKATYTVKRVSMRKILQVKIVLKS